MEVIEQERIRRRFSQAVNTYDDHAEAQKRICAHLVQLLTVYTSSHFRRVLEIGCGSGGFTRLLKQECQIEEWVLNDLVETWQSAIEELFPSAPPLFLSLRHIFEKLSEAYNYGFGVACISLIISMAIYMGFRSTFKHADVNTKQAQASHAPQEELSPAETKQRITALLLVFAVVLFFWMAFHQNGLTLSLIHI